MMLIPGASVGLLCGSGSHRILTAREPVEMPEQIMRSGVLQLRVDHDPQDQGEQCVGIQHLQTSHRIARTHTAANTTQVDQEGRRDTKSTHTHIHTHEINKRQHRVQTCKAEVLTRHGKSTTGRQSFDPMRCDRVTADKSENSTTLEADLGGWLWAAGSAPFSPAPGGGAGE
jgi:hypothetical protein